MMRDDEKEGEGSRSAVGPSVLPRDRNTTRHTVLPRCVKDCSSASAMNNGMVANEARTPHDHGTPIGV